MRVEDLRWKFFQRDRHASVDKAGTEATIAHMIEDVESLRRQGQNG